MTEKLRLKWTDFQPNILGSYQELRKESEFSDVSLVCEEDYKIEAHRIILSACSPFFSTILKRNQHSHPMIYMRGMKAKDLEAIVDFIYHGETSIAQEDLNEFLALAEELQLKGLTGSQNGEEDLVEEENKVRETKMKRLKTRNKINLDQLFDKTPQDKKLKEGGKIFVDSSSNIEDKIKSMKYEKISYDTEVKNKNFGNISGDIDFNMLQDANTDELRGQINSMMEKVTEGEFKWICTECGKASKDKQGMSRHVETHIEGVSYPCNQCEAVKRSYFF